MTSGSEKKLHLPSCEFSQASPDLVARSGTMGRSEQCHCSGPWGKEEPLKQPLLLLGEISAQADAVSTATYTVLDRCYPWKLNKTTKLMAVLMLSLG